MYRFRHITATILLVLFLAVQFFSILIQKTISSHQTNIAKNIKSHKHNLELSFTSQEWMSIKKIRQNEIEIKGKLFDILSIKHQDGIVKIIGHFDTKEDHLIAINKNLKKKSNSLEKQHDHLSVLFIDSQIMYDFFKPSFVKANSMNTSIQLYKLYLQASSPPPKV